MKLCSNGHRPTIEPYTPRRRKPTIEPLSLIGGVVIGGVLWALFIGAAIVAVRAWWGWLTAVNEAVAKIVGG